MTQIPPTNSFLLFLFLFLGPVALEIHLPQYFFRLSRSFAFLLAFLILVLGGTRRLGMFGAAIAMTVVVQHGSPFSRYASGSGVSSLGDLEDSGSDLARLMDYLAQEEEP